MEQAGQSEGSESHGGGHHSVAPLVAQVEGDHGDDGDKQALAADAGQEGPVENGLPGVPGLLVQQALPGGLHADGDGGQGIGEQVDEQQVHRLEGHGQGQQGSVEHAENAGGVARRCV